MLFQADQSNQLPFHYAVRLGESEESILKFYRLMRNSEPADSPVFFKEWDARSLNQKSRAMLNQMLRKALFSREKPEFEEADLFLKLGADISGANRDPDY